MGFHGCIGDATCARGVCSYHCDLSDVKVAGCDSLTHTVGLPLRYSFGHASIPCLRFFPHALLINDLKKTSVQNAATQGSILRKPTMPGLKQSRMRVDDLTKDTGPAGQCCAAFPATHTLTSFLQTSTRKTTFRSKAIAKIPQTKKTMMMRGAITKPLGPSLHIWQSSACS